MAASARNEAPLFGVIDEAHFAHDGGHGRPHQHNEWRLVDPSVGVGALHSETLLEKGRELGAVPVGLRVGEIEEDSIDSGVCGRGRGVFGAHVFEGRETSSGFVGGVETQQVGLEPTWTGRLA